MAKRIISFDPGKANMAVSVIELQGNVPTILANSILECPVDHLNIGFREGLADFLAEVEEWTTKYEPQAVIAERFQSRGGRTGTTGEVVGIMLGALCTHYMHLPLRLITAAMWKNEFQRKHGNLKDIYKTCRTTPHQLDSAGIGLYGLNKGLGIELEYTLDDFIQQLENTSHTALINRRIKK